MRTFILTIVAVMAVTASVSAEIVKVTGYCPCTKCCGVYGNKLITASGYKIDTNKPILLAAAPKSIPFGTIATVPGYGDAVVLDRGGAIKQGRLDVLFLTHQQARNWGVKYLNVSYSKGKSYKKSYPKKWRKDGDSKWKKKDTKMSVTSNFVRS